VSNGFHHWTALAAIAAEPQPSGPQIDIACEREYPPRMRRAAALIVFALLLAPAAEGTPAQEPAAIAYVGTGCCHAQIYVINADGTGARQLTKNLRRAPEGDYAPAWSPDGKRVAFVRAIGRVSNIYLVNVAGGGVQRLTRTFGGDQTPDWSPNGRQVLFASAAYKPGVDLSDIFVVGTNGRGRHALTREVGASDPAWSPDGRLIAFSRQKPAGIYVMNADGTGRRRVTNHPSDRRPDWSPDGTSIVFVRQVRGAGAELFVVGVDGSGLERLTNNRVDDEAPSWAGDGSSIAFSSVRGGVENVYVMNVDGTGVRRVTHGGAVDPAWQPQPR
jgi:TolB protein